MSHLSNLRRDMFWIPEPTTITMDTNHNFVDDPTVATDGVGYVKHGCAQTGKVSSIGGSTYRSFGVCMQAFENDNVPFRIKAIANRDTIWGFGFTDTLSANVTAGNHRLIGFNRFDAGMGLDEVVCIRPRTSSPKNYIVFFGSVGGTAGDYFGTMSVQSLLGQPDTYSSKVT